MKMYYKTNEIYNFNMNLKSLTNNHNVKQKSQPNNKHKTQVAGSQTIGY